MIIFGCVTSSDEIVNSLFSKAFLASVSALIDAEVGCRSPSFVFFRTLLFLKATFAAVETCSSRLDFLVS